MEQKMSGFRTKIYFFIEGPRMPVRRSRPMSLEDGSAEKGVLD